MESTFDRIVRKSGMKPSNCKCQSCKSQCSMPCKGTPEDMFKIIGAGYDKRVMAIQHEGLQIITPLYDKAKKSCTFFNNGLCELHDSGLKPTEGKLSHHSTSFQKFKYKKSISYFIMREWENLSEEQTQSLISKHIQNKK